MAMRHRGMGAIVGIVVMVVGHGGIVELQGWAALRRDDSVRAVAKEPLFDGIEGVHRQISTGSAEAQRYFDQGLGFLFAFNHDEAERAFRQAATLDPRCAMAWWGIAVAQGPHINHPAVPEPRARMAHEAIETARTLVDGCTPTERRLVETASRRYVWPQPKDRKELDEAYTQAMGELWREQPADADLGALYAEALMDLRPWDLWTRQGEPQPGTDKVLEVLQAVLAIQPRHPLACHLFIHAVEASPHPEHALDVADRLRSLQPNLPHLIHMPSHIDVRLGHWKEAIVTNERAIAADQAYRAIRPSQSFYRVYMLHNRQMLAYAAMMRGESRRAIDAVDAMLVELPVEWAREHAAIVDGIFAMPLEVRMRFGKWDEILAAPEPEAVFPLARALRHAARGVAYAARNQVEPARQERETFLSARKRVADDARFGNSPASTLLDVAEHLLTGEILYREGKEDAALDALRLAVRAEDDLNYDEPPDWIQPVRHALGAVLLQQGRSDEAEAVYREDLKRLPENGWSLFGLMRALDLQGRHDDARAVRERWDTVWKDADIPLSSSCFCLPGV